ncbi:hypothetical protein, partial [Anoxybacillus sp. LAT27]|uniref:hypothetical protein n=1 Tax=Anoxybacillus sp. LAT27 TaxID=2878409 RepID=UPI001EDBB707
SPFCDHHDYNRTNRSFVQEKQLSFARNGGADPALLFGHRRQAEREAKKMRDVPRFGYDKKENK